MISNKKANAVSDSLLFMGILFVLAMVAVPTALIFSEINADIQNDDDMSTLSKQKVDDLNDKFPSTLDGVFITVFGFMWLLTIIASALIRAHPIFFVIMVLLMSLLLFVGAIMSNTYEEVTTDDTLITFSTAFPMTNFIMGNFVAFVLGIGFSIIIVLFGKEVV